MTKKIMKSLSLVCAVLLFFSLNVMAVSPEDADDVFYVNGIRVDAQYLRNQDAANEAFSRFFNHFEKNGMFPEYYAGSYIDTTTGHLVFLTYNIDKEEMAMLKKVIQNENVSYLEAEHSMNELIRVQNELTDMMDHQQTRSSFNIVGVEINSQGNSVRILVDESVTYQEKKQTSLILDTLGCDFDILEIVPGTMNKEFASIQPGDGIHASTSRGSVGYVCKALINGRWKQGFVTAQHVMSASTSGINKGLSLIGYYRTGINDHNGNCDVAFVEFKDGVTYSNYIGKVLDTYPAATLRNAVTNTPRQNSIVFKKGATTGITSGLVTSESASAQFATTENGSHFITTRDLVGISCSGENGDSGGTVFTYVSTTQGDAGLATAIGVFKGGSNGQFYASKHGNYPFDCVVS